MEVNQLIRFDSIQFDSIHDIYLFRRIWFDTVAVREGSMQLDTGGQGSTGSTGSKIKYDTIRYDTIWYDTIQYNRALYFEDVILKRREERRVQRNGRVGLFIVEEKESRCSLLHPIRFSIDDSSSPLLSSLLLLLYPLLSCHPC